MLNKNMTYSNASIMSWGSSNSYSSNNSPRRVSDDIASLDSWSDALDLSNEQPLGPENPGGSCAKLAAQTLGHNQSTKQGRRTFNILTQNPIAVPTHIPDTKHDFSSSKKIHKRAKEMQEVMPVARHSEIAKKLSQLSSGPKQISDEYSINGEPSASVSPQTRNVPTDRTSCSVDQHPHVYKSKLYRCLPQDFPQTIDSPTHCDKNTGNQRCFTQHVRRKLSDTSRDQIVDGDKVKTKLLSAWNNMKYGWTMKTKANFRYDSPIYLLGQLYHRDRQMEDRELLDTKNHLKNVDEFHQDYSSRIWFTYRREFSPLAGTKMTTDCGWGCMLRSCQMMVAQAFVLHFLGREWRVYGSQTREQNTFYHEIIRWFGDHESDKMPFSLHKLVDIGCRLGKNPGDWYGPSSVSFIFRDALMKAERSLPILNTICLYVAHDCTVYIQDVVDLCTANRKSSFTSSSSSEMSESRAPAVKSTQDEWKRAVIILIPMRLGGESLNEIYIPCVQSMLSHDNCVGVIGGKPKHSMYFVGFQDDKLIYMDPHYCQDMVNTTKPDFPVHTFHCVSPRKLSFSKMDPSCTVGFYCRSYEDFYKFVDEAEKFVVPPKQKGQYPLFIFSEGRSTDVSLDMSEHKEKGFLKIRHYRKDKDGRIRSPTVDSEEYVIL
ncbi:cysteine protease ATG4C-like [Gigantopelta aegis]|uniref:cysteine protease ATG4C-like n=1 Tax=Gigantopelta aegis TaxID=1735272 RepID=UPI001B8877B2|nr:cysteine protease ATG4C-like [Gigantopelta aegis]